MSNARLLENSAVSVYS